MKIAGKEGGGRLLKERTSHILVGHQYHEAPDLEFTLENSYFVLNRVHYQQIFGCPMGSPVSAILANLVVETMEERAITTTKTPPKRWYRYADDSHSCVKRDKVDDFHTHLNSIN